jgi:ribosome maturation factor RimP
MRKINPELHERLAKLVAVLGYELIGCEIISGSRHALFRIYIDSVQAQKGITVEDCSRVSHQVSALLDVENPLSGHYTLEVSSPGIDRPLFALDHYTKYIGSRVKIKLSSPIEQRRHYKGVLQRIDGENIYLLVDGVEQEVALPFSIIEKGNLIADIHL